MAILSIKSCFFDSPTLQIVFKSTFIKFLLKIFTLLLFYILVYFNQYQKFKPITYKDSTLDR